MFGVKTIRWEHQQIMDFADAYKRGCLGESLLPTARTARAIALALRHLLTRYDIVVRSQTPHDEDEIAYVSEYELDCENFDLPRSNQLWLAVAVTRYFGELAHRFVPYAWVEGRTDIPYLEWLRTNKQMADQLALCGKPNVHLHPLVHIAWRAAGWALTQPVEERKEFPYWEYVW